MHRYTLTVPLRDNDGDSLAFLHSGVSGRLAREFGGLTVLRDAVGVWSAPDAANPGREPVKVYIVDTAREDALALLQRLAASIARFAGQDAVYLTRQPIETFLVTG